MSVASLARQVIPEEQWCETLSALLLAQATCASLPGWSADTESHSWSQRTVVSDSSTVLCFNANLLLCHSCCWEPRYDHVIMKTVMKEEIRVEYCVVSSHAVVVLWHSDCVNECTAVHNFSSVTNGQAVCNIPCCLKQGSHVSAIYCQSAQRDNGWYCCYSSFVNRLPSAIPSPTNIQYFLGLTR